MKKKILFLTGTRADFGKLKSLMVSVEHSELFECIVFITGMHTLKRYGYTVEEVYRSLPDHKLLDGTRSVCVYYNQVQGESMERVLANTIEGLSRYVMEVSPDLIVVHGDRVEALAGAIVGSLRNILVAHIEGGEISGTVDEIIRHAVSKMSHAHFVSNEMAKTRLIQMGEIPNSIFVIGSPDIDLMLSDDLPNLDEVKRYYEIAFLKYAIVIFHPITTDLKETRQAAKDLVGALLRSQGKYVVIYPNNDEGCDLVFSEYNRLLNNPSFKILPSMRVEYFLTLLKHAYFLVGNSSAGIRECPVFGVPSINISTRQSGRATMECIENVDGGEGMIQSAIEKRWSHFHRFPRDMHFGRGASSALFTGVISTNNFWTISRQKQFVTYGAGHASV
jgi:UDP-N-acetylglucosamine 2-epimerase (hydrolysing)